MSPGASDHLERTNKFVGVFTLLFMGGVFAGLGLIAGYVFVLRPYLSSIRARDWIEVSCVIQSSEVESHYSSECMTYSPKIVYKYTFEGKEFTSTRYGFVGGGSSSYNRHSEVVARYPPSSASVCFVNPQDPGQAVLNKDFSSDFEWPGLVIIILFILVGTGLLAYSFRIWRTNSWVPKVPVPKQRPLSEYRASPRCQLELSPEHSFLSQWVGGVLFVAFWNFIVYAVFLYDSGFSQVLRTPLIIGFALFGGIGAFFTLAVVYSLCIGICFSQPRIFADRQTVYSGEALVVGWSVPGGFNPLTSIDLRLTCAKNGNGGDDSKQKEVVIAEIPIIDLKKSKNTQYGEREIRIPEDSMPSFETLSEKIGWAITMTCKNFNLIPYDVKYPILVFSRDKSLDQPTSYTVDSGL